MPEIGDKVNGTSVDCLKMDCRGPRMESALIVLGRFQPFHNGHAEMINAAISYLGVGDSDLPLRICIGSSEAEQSLDNPWTAEEREQMIRVWLDGIDAEIVHVPDLGDPPNYVRHAEKFHGPPGTILSLIHI